MSEFRISVVIPTRNRAALLAQTLASVRAQTLQDAQVVVSDNHSSDATWAWLNAEAARHPNLTARRPPQALAMTDHWNFAVRQTTGTYVALLSDDDLWEPTFLQSVAEVIARHPEVDVVGSNFWFLHGDGRRTLRVLRRTNRSGLVRNPLRAVLSENLIHLNCALFRRSLFEEFGGFAPHWAADFELWLLAAARRKVFYYLPAPLATYRVHAGMATEPIALQRLTAELLKNRRLGSWRADALRRFACGSAYARLAALYAQAGQMAEAYHSLREGFRSMPFHPRILATFFHLFRRRSQAT